MLAGSGGACLSALLVDYDNVYLSLKRRNDEAAALFAQQPVRWLQMIVSGRLIKMNDGAARPGPRRMAINRCYGNPVPRRDRNDKANDPNSFIFVRHHFLRAGFEIVDCPPLTAQLKNSSDIRMAIEVTDLLAHQTRFDEFIILSGDADFTPVLHRIRSFGRRTVIYSNDYTAAPYAALCDGRIEEADLVAALRENTLSAPPQSPSSAALSFQGARPSGSSTGSAIQPAAAAEPARTAREGTSSHDEPTIRALMEDFQTIGQEILDLVVRIVGEAEKPVPIAYLANRATAEIGAPKTLGTNWAGSGGFLNFLSKNLPNHLRLTETPPHNVYDPARHVSPDQAAPGGGRAQASHSASTAPHAPVLRPAANSSGSRLAELQNSIARIYDASQAPPLPPSEYQLLFNLISAQVHEHGFDPTQTVPAVVVRAAEAGVRLAEADVAFVIGAVDEIDPWLEHSRSAAAIARHYRDSVLARCRSAGLSLTDDEYQLIQVWFGANQWPPAGSEPEGAPPGRQSSASGGQTNQSGGRGIGAVRSGSRGEFDIPLPNFEEPPASAEIPTSSDGLAQLVNAHMKLTKGR